MNKIFSYEALIISNSEKTIQKTEKITQSISIGLSNASSIINALEHLMDFKIDIIFLDFSIGEEESLQFLNHISNDYENSFTPIIMLTSIDQHKELAKEFLNFNIISIMCKANWTAQALKLLAYLRISKLNLHTIQNTLIQSESRGAMDQLTGAYNRHGCEDIFGSLCSREKAYSEPFSLIMIDIDFFKAVNDTYGHDTGDNVLQHFARIMMSSIRRDDSLIRIGGEEFIIFLSNASKNIAVKSAEKIRLKIEEAVYTSHNLKITASFGVVEYENNENMQSIIKRADTLLYKAKDSGRNMVVSKETEV